jgi:hypothetical protein
VLHQTAVEGSRTYHVFALRIDHDTVIHSTGVTVMAVGRYMEYYFKPNPSCRRVWLGGQARLRRQRPRKGGFGIRRMGIHRKWMIVSLALTSPESITLSISTLFWASLLSLLVVVLITFLTNFAMVRAFPLHQGYYSRSSPPSSGSLGSPERIATSESSSGSPEPRMYLCSVPSLVLVSKYPMRLVRGRQGGILISISALISPCNHT